LKVKSKLSQRLVGIAKARLFAATLQQTVGAACQFIRYQAGDQVNGSHGFGLRLLQAGFEYRGHGAEP
jgi:hypothetical protein